MQTFLPYPSFKDSARCLDRQRLGKQRVECKQLLLALGVPVGEHQPRPSSWASHPAARMWRGHELILCEYATAVCDEWIRRGYRDTLRPQFEDLRWSLLLGSRWHACPNWIGYDAFHASHRSNLLRKLPSHYGQFGWAEPADLPYVWPVEQEVGA